MSQNPVAVAYIGVVHIFNIMRSSSPCVASQPRPTPTTVASCGRWDEIKSLPHFPLTPRRSGRPTVSMFKRQVDFIAGGCAVSEELFKQGLVNDRNMLSASALVSEKNHDLVARVHESFMTAGASHIVTSNYQVVPGLGFTHDEVREYTRLAGRLAVEARRRAGKEATAKICGSLPPLMPSYRSDRTIQRNDGYEMYLLIGEALWPFVDVYVAETMSSVKEAKMAYESVYHLKKPVMVSFALNRSGEQLRSGEPVLEAIDKILDFSDALATDNNVDNVLAGILFNCSQPEDIAKALKHIHDSEIAQEMLRSRSIALGGYGDRISSSSTAGVLEEQIVAGAMHSALDMEIYSRFVMRWVEYGASIVGGCCAIPPKYIAHATQSIDGMSP